jgi:hypothetical protein
MVEAGGLLVLEDRLGPPQALAASAVARQTLSNVARRISSSSHPEPLQLRAVGRRLSWTG